MPRRGKLRTVGGSGLGEVSRAEESAPGDRLAPAGLVSADIAEVVDTLAR